MRTTRRLLIIAVVLALPISVAAWAAAAPGGIPGKPTVPDDPTTTTTADWPKQCVDHDPETTAIYEATLEYGTPYDLLLPAGKSVACVDVTAPAGIWTVELVDISGRVIGMHVDVRDAVPGDWCAVEGFKRPATGPLATWEIPASAIDACPGDQFEDEAAPLVFFTTYQGKDGAYTLRVTLEPPAST